jgi:D-arabinose 1-dehydrogenase-like Zn-dependent alcohol dehydrogenase
MSKGPPHEHKIVQTRFGGPEVLEPVGQAPPAREDLAADEDLVGGRAGRRARLCGIVRLAGAKALVPEVTRIFDLADAAEAHRLLESGHVQGKVILRR